MAGLFDRSQEHAMLYDTLRRFVREHCELEARSRRLGGPSPQRLALWSDLAALGALGAAVSEDRGGFGGTIRDLAVVQDALAPGLAVEPVLGAAISARLAALLESPGESDLASGLVSGKRVVLLAHTEGFDPFAPPRAAATPHPGGFQLHGAKPCIRHADVATDFMFTAMLPGDAVGVFLMPAGAPGLSASPTRLIDAAGAADLVADGVALSADACLGSGDPASAAITEALEWGLAGLCAETASLADAVNRATFDYLDTRQQFGTKLAQFQALQHRAADMAIAQEEAAAMAEMALSALEARPCVARSRAILAASLACDAAGRRVAHEAIQMFGGMGVSDELAISHYARRLAAIRAQIGTTDARAARLTALEEDLA